MDYIIHYWISGWMDSLQLVKYSGSRKVLETLVKYPDRQFTISELARESGVPFASAWRMVQRWEPAGMLETRRVGKSITVRLHTSEYLDSILSILKISLSPQAFTARALTGMLAKERNVKEAYLFGSVALGNEKPESDIDVALLAGKGYHPNRLVFLVYEKYGTKVVPITFGKKKELDAFMSGKGGQRLK